MLSWGLRRAKCRLGTSQLHSARRTKRLRATRLTLIELEANLSLRPTWSERSAIALLRHSSLAITLRRLPAFAPPRQYSNRKRRASGLRLGTTSALAGRCSILPMTGLSVAPVAERETNLFSLHRRSIKRRSQGRSTCCGSEKKFRNVHIKYARCTRFGCTYLGPIGVSS